ncbi:MAG: Wzz/FepE/Etk N-terminal domain-containing protein [Candidatus Cloacimonadales bacterium]
MENKNENKQIDLFDVLIVLAKHKKFILITTVIVSIAAVIYSLVTPEIWRSTATIMPLDNEMSNFSFSSSLSGLQSSLLGKTTSSSATNLVTVMNSRTFSEDVINKFDLIDYFEIEDPDSLVAMHLALEAFGEMMRTIAIDEESGLIIISIESKDKYMSAEIANYFIDKIEIYNQSTSKSKGREKREFLEKRLAEVEAEIEDLIQQLLAFQVENKVVGMNEQVSAAVEIYAKLEAEKTTLEMEKEYIAKTIGVENPKYQAIEERVNIINSKIIQLKTTSGDASYLFNLDEIADLGVQSMRLQTELDLRQKVFEFLYPQYENAKIEEVKDLSTIEVIDLAKPAGQRLRPKRAQLCVIAFVLAIIFSSVLVLFIHLLHNHNTQLLRFKNELFS